MMDRERGNGKGNPRRRADAVSATSFRLLAPLPTVKKKKKKKERRRRKKKRKEMERRRRKKKKERMKKKRMKKMSFLFVFPGPHDMCVSIWFSFLTLQFFRFFQVV
jgi:hypothetical protein